MKKPALGLKGFAVLFALLGILSIASGILGLMKPAQPLDDIFWARDKGARFAGTPAHSSICYSHVVDVALILPVGNEYFYLLFSEDRTKVLCVRSLKKLDSLTDLETVDGVLKKLDADNEYDFQKLNTHIDEYFIEEYYLDIGAKQLYIERILLGSCILVSMGFLAYFVRLGKNSWKEYTNGERVMNILGCGVLLVMLWLFLRLIMLGL